jgi:hypothetical protein
MELEDQQLTDGINDIITLLEDDKELKAKECSKQAVQNLKSVSRIWVNILYYMHILQRTTTFFIVRE